jgi:hypothetical protein
MFRQVPSAKEQALDERLRREAFASRPTFSEPFHDRIVGAIQRRRAEESEAHANSRRLTAAGYSPAAWFSRVAIAACVLCAVAIGWWFNGNHRQPNMPANDFVAAAGNQAGPASAPNDAAAPTTELPSIGELADRAADSLDELAAAASLTPQSAQLEHDARLAADMLIERLPVDVYLAEEP